VPLLFFIFLLSHIDRANLGYAALQMNSALGFSPSIYGIGAGIFSLGLVVCMIPVTMIVTPRRHSSLDRAHDDLLEHRGDGDGLVWDTSSFFTARFLLGAAASRVLSDYADLY